MKVLKANLWNRVFHKKKLQQQKKKYEELTSLVAKAEEFDRQIVNAKGLLPLLNIHKEMWTAGLQNSNIGPNEYGMFRTKDIATMKPEEVFLGNIYGLWTIPVTEWENQKNAIYGVNGFGINPGTTVYELVLYQYKDMLRSNLKVIAEEKKNRLEEYRKS